MFKQIQIIFSNNNKNYPSPKFLFLSSDLSRIYSLDPGCLPWAHLPQLTLQCLDIHLTFFLHSPLAAQWPHLGWWSSHGTDFDKTTNNALLVSSLAESHPSPLSLNWAPTARFNCNDKILMFVFFLSFSTEGCHGYMVRLCFSCTCYKIALFEFSWSFTLRHKSRGKYAFISYEITLIMSLLHVHHITVCMVKNSIFNKRLMQTVTKNSAAKQ